MFTNNVEAESVDAYLEKSQQDEPELQKLFMEARNIWNTRGPLCDSEGFYQHRGECWNDALQQVMNNTDGIKEWIQYFYIYSVIPTSFYLWISDNEFLNNVEKNIPQDEKQEVIEEQKKWITLYFREAQKRFLRHYITESKRRNLDKEICALEQPAEIARNALRAIASREGARKKGVEGEQGAIFGLFSKQRNKNNFSKRAYRPVLKSYEAKSSLRGGNDLDLVILLQEYKNRIALFNKEVASNIKINYRAKYNNPWPSSYTNAILIGIIKETGGGHEMAFYTCGGQEFFYEDNYGLIPFEWHDYFEKINSDFGNLTDHYFVDVTFVSKETNRKFSTSFYPLACMTNYHTNDVTYKLYYDEVFYTVQSGKKDSFEFFIETSDTKIRGSFNKKTDWKYDTGFELDIFSPSVIANQENSYRFNARLDNRSIQSLDMFEMMKEDERLAYIEKTPLEQLNKLIRQEGNEDTHILDMVVDLGFLPEFEALLKKGVNPNFYIGEVPFILNVLVREAKKNETPFFDILIQYKPDITLATKNEKKIQPIHFASIFGGTEIVKKILSLGADVNAKDGRGMTPVYRAALKGNTSIVSLLCEYGADATVLSEKGESLLDIVKDEETKTALLKCLKKNTPPPSGGSTRLNKKRKNLRKKRKTRRHL